MVGIDGAIVKAVCPFGPISPWREIGRKHTDNPWMKQLEQWYPNPPLVIFLSNNEHSKLRWTEVEKSKRYLDKYGPGRDADFKRKVVAEGWIERYRALQGGLRDGLDSATWKKNSIFVGYDAFGPPHLGRWGGWINHSLYSKGRMDSSALMWDGGSPSYYTDDWNGKTDYIVWSPQVEFMNLVFMQREAFETESAVSGSSSPSGTDTTRTRSGRRPIRQNVPSIVRPGKFMTPIATQVSYSSDYG